ncbi:hypothetical protein [Bartonella doshiae]|uniref:hypothetical protein n=1 Tax=Bartonella doshiae TaxID=33044 RepID=UPI000944AFD7|nr:hypothetical protein [Bartonella doshiae]
MEKQFQEGLSVAVITIERDIVSKTADIAVIQDIREQGGVVFAKVKGETFFSAFWGCFYFLITLFFGYR